MTDRTHVGRLTPVDEAGQGTPAAIWSRWDRAFPLLDLTTLRDVVVVAPHPDDEILGVGALMSRLVSSGARVRVVAVTDGDAAYPGSPTLDPPELAALRIAESEAACAAVGVDAPLRLRIPDGGIAEHEARLERRLSELLRPEVTCLSTWAGDGHPDHEATGRAAASACARTGATLVQYPVWMWHWASPGDPEVPWDGAAVLALTEAELVTKRAAVECFVTQTRALSSHPRDAAILPPFVIDRLVTGREMVFR